MTRHLRVIDTGLSAAAWNIAVTAALGETHRHALSPETLRFHRYAPTVLLGHHQDSERNVSARACAARGVSIARRVTGGGAVYMDEGVLAWDLVIDRRRFADLGSAAAALCWAAADALRCCGVNAEWRAPQDVVVDRRKLCGTSGGFDGRTLTLQGAMLVDPDLGAMADVLVWPAANAERHPVCALVTVREVIGHVPDLNAITTALTDSFSDALGLAWSPAELTRRETGLANDLLRREIGTHALLSGYGRA